MKLQRAAVVWLGLVAACTASAQNPAANGELFAGRYVSVKAPSAGTWHLRGRSDTTITFAGGEIGNTFVAEVLMFRLAPAATPEEFEALIRKNTDPEIDVDPNHPDRYELLERSVKSLHRAALPLRPIQSSD